MTIPSEIVQRIAQTMSTVIDIGDQYSKMTSVNESDTPVRYTSVDEIKDKFSQFFTPMGLG